MNVLVVGGTRFFGIPMVKKLIADGHDVTIATRGNATDPFGDKVQRILMDRSDPENVKVALAGKAFDVIIDKIAYCSNDVKRLLENVSCKKYIQMSSCAVYSDDRENIKEDAFDPAGYPLVWMERNDDYAEGKRQAERAALEYLDPSRCIFVRYPVVMGENDYTGRLQFYVDHVLDEKPMHVDDLDVSMAFIHEKEAGEFIAHLADRNLCGPVNGSSVGMISSRAIIDYVEKRSGKKAVIKPDGEDAPYNGTAADLSYDLSKARSAGFRFSGIGEWIFALLDFDMNR